MNLNVIQLNQYDFSYSNLTAVDKISTDIDRRSYSMLTLTLTHSCEEAYVDVLVFQMNVTNLRQTISELSINYSAPIFCNKTFSSC